MKFDRLGFVPPLNAIGCFDFEGRLAAVVSCDYSNLA